MKNDEEQMQIACVRWFEVQFPGLRNLLHHSPNGGRRDKVTAAKFKAMGTRKGFPDLILLLPNHEGYHYLAIELKTKTGRQEPEQKEFERLMNSHGGKYVVIRDTLDFIREVKAYIYRPKEMPPDNPNPYRFQATKEEQEK